RSTYVTRFFNKKLISMLNDPQYTELFNNKNLFYHRFDEYLKREWLDTSIMAIETFQKFIAGKDTIFAKPNVGESGKGIEKLYTKDFNSHEEMYEYISTKDFGVIEETLEQHEEYSKLYPHAVNSIRCVTIVVEGTAKCVYATAKMGNLGKFVDNLESDGLCIPINQETGRLVGVAHTSKLIVYDRHPYTGILLDGYKVPMVKEAIDLCLKAALEIDGVGYVGWDVCITPTGPAIIEGNDYPGYDFWQLPEHTPDKIGLKPYYKSLIPAL
ncbi:MAG: carboxylate--amine ligase, partial [Oscillospiraceae bacterium]|nr:carboxylate--amine ligase [Oscillospiraceae bacterium]